MKTLQIILAAMLLASSTLRAQLVADGATNTLSNVTNSFTGNVTVGTNSPFTLLVLSDNTLLTGPANVTIGRNTTARSNEVRLISSSARWQMGGLFAFPTLYLGSNGAFNRLVLSNGATMSAFFGIVGGQVSSSNNLALVTGPGSAWHLASLYLGSSGAGNQAMVSDGGLLDCASSIIGAFPGSSNNLAVVTGSGSVWTNQNNLTIGLFATGNQLLVRDGGAVRAGRGLLGSDPAGSNNVAVITGAGSVWSNPLGLDIGAVSANNQMIVSNGGTAVSGGASIGSAENANGNSAIVTDAGSRWLISTNVYVGSNSALNRLVVSNGATLFAEGNGLIGLNTMANSNSVLLTDSGTVLSNWNNFTLGNLSVGNRLALSNGAVMYIGADGIVGFNKASSSNSVMVTDPGTILMAGLNSNLVNTTFYVGSNGSFNSMIVSNGARVDCNTAVLGHNFYGGIGFDVGSNNLVVITGTGSVWNARSSFFVGDVTTGNRLIITNGGGLECAFAVIGAFGGTNEAIVTGPGSFWRSTSSHDVGANGGNRLVITNGGTVINSGRVVLGLTGSGDNVLSRNRIVVDGGSLYATNATQTSVLNVRNGTNALHAGLIDVDQLVMITTNGFFEFNGGLLISRGAVISNGSPFVIGGNATAPAIWDVRAGVSNHIVAENLYIGNNSSFNQLLVTNGAVLDSGSLTIIGFNEGTRSNSALVANPGSRWSVNGELYIGSGANANTLVVSNGASVDSLHGRIGSALSASNNLVLVTGAGTTWSNSGVLRVGDIGPGNQLIVSNGGSVFAGGSAFVGVNSFFSADNRVTVDGGTLRVTNVAANGLLEIRRGTNVLNAGLIEADILRMTNAQGFFEFNGGTVSIKSSRISIGPPFRIGNGVSPATFHLAGNGLHDFLGIVAVFVTNNATLTGNGTVSGGLVVVNGGTLSPGVSVGKMIFTNAPVLQGSVLMEISKNGTVLTNDQIQVAGTLTYGGSLTVSNLGPTALAAGDSFQLFSATAYAGAFTSLNLPPLAPPLFWKNNLLVSGSLEVAAPPAISLSAGPHTQNFDTLATNGSANLWRDNVTLLGWYAAKSVAPTNITTYRAADGSDNAGALYSFGSTGSGERALGSIGSDDVGIISYGLGFTNDTGASVSNFVLSYTGEQWRNSSSSITNTLTFWYRVSAAALTNPEPGSVTDWTPQAGLDFASPTVTGAGVGINGNTPANRQLFVSVPVSGLTVPPGHCVFFLWHDNNDVGDDQGLAVDDLTVAFAVTRPQLTSILVNPTNGFAQLFGVGETNLTYGFEAATNLNAPIFWQRIGSNTADGAGVFLFTDTNAPAFPMRFYRALFP